MKPSTFVIKPFESVTHNHQCEIVARNIMIVLARTGDKFRKLTWQEYKKEQQKDRRFCGFDREFFERVNYLALGNKEEILNFSKDWQEAYELSK